MTLSKQDFINFIQTVQYWGSVWDLSKLQGWAAGTIGSVNLDRLYAAWLSGDVTVTYNFITEESGNNLERGDWVNYKTNPLDPEILFLQNAISDLTYRLQQYQGASGENPDLIGTIEDQIARFKKLLAEYISQN